MTEKPKPYARLDLREKAFRRLSAWWGSAAASPHATFDRVNEDLPEEVRYPTQAVHNRFNLARADAITAFAEDLGLVTKDQAAEFRRRATKDYPESRAWGLWEICPECGDILDGIGMFSGRRPDNGERGGGAHYKCLGCQREFGYWLSGGPKVVSDWPASKASGPVTGQPRTLGEEMEKLAPMWTTERADWYLSRFKDGSMLPIHRGQPEHAMVIEDNEVAAEVCQRMLAAGVEVRDVGGGR